MVRVSLPKAHKTPTQQLLVSIECFFLNNYPNGIMRRGTILQRRRVSVYTTARGSLSRSVVFQQSSFPLQGRDSQASQLTSEKFLASYKPSSFKKSQGESLVLCISYNAKQESSCFFHTELQTVVFISFLPKLPGRSSFL